MKKTYSIGIIVVIIISVLGIGILFNPNNLFNFYQGYYKTINRYTTSPNQERALILAESFDYSKLLNRDVVTGNDRSIWLEYISNETFNFIDSYADANKANTRITLNYTAWVYEFTDLELTNSSNNFSILSNGINYASKNSTEDDNYKAFYQYNPITNWFDKQDTNFSINYKKNGFIVDMKLDFNNIYGALAGTSSYIRQTLIFNDNYQILHIFFHPTNVIMY